jgi:hypothetical protein
VPKRSPFFAGQTHVVRSVIPAITSVRRLSPANRRTPVRFAATQSGPYMLRNETTHRRARPKSHKKRSPSEERNLSSASPARIIPARTGCVVKKSRSKMT